MKRLSTAPLPAYFIFSKVFDIIYKKRMYRTVMFHSVEFIALFNEIMAKKANDLKRADGINKRFNRFIKFKTLLRKLR
jgi:hypothetical protein